MRLGRVLRRAVETQPVWLFLASVSAAGLLGMLGPDIVVAISRVLS